MNEIKGWMNAFIIASFTSTVTSLFLENEIGCYCAASVLTVMINLRIIIPLIIEEIRKPDVIPQAVDNFISKVNEINERIKRSNEA